MIKAHKEGHIFMKTRFVNQYYIVMIRDENWDESTESQQMGKDAEDNWWSSCSATTVEGDALLTCRTGEGITDEWEVTSNKPEPDPIWGYRCDMNPRREIDPPITIAELKIAFPYRYGRLEDLSVVDRFGRLVHTNFRGQKSGCWKIPYECVLIILKLRRLKP